jgi:hypothetical protein
MSIKLEYGDPNIKPATYTRFILPFAYCLHDEKKTAQHFYYEKDEEIDPERKKYLTYETADVLFKNAKRFVLKDLKSNLLKDVPFRYCVADESITFYVKPPSLILFEYPKNQENQCETADCRQCSIDEHNVLRTGFLVVEIYFPEQYGNAPSFDQLLALNEIIRYWQRPYKGHEDEMKRKIGDLSFMPDSEKTDNKESDESIRFYFERWASLLDIPIKCGDGFFKLFPDKWMCDAKKYVSGEDVTSPGWAIYSDNRTFVWTCAIVKGGGKTLIENFNMFDMPRARAWDFGHWIKLLNVDKPGENVYDTHKSSDFEKKWAEERTYKRWEEGGTFYGFNYHCGAMIGPVYTEPPLWKHFRQMYFDQTLLLLYIRVTTFRFSMDLNRISNDVIKEDKDTSKWREKFQRLRWSFALFTNLYQFPLLSNQQQAIEMYSLARKHMDVDDLFKEVKAEIDNGHEYLVAGEGIEQSSRMEKLTWIATIGLAISIPLSLWGMTIIIDPIKDLCLILQFLCLVGTWAITIPIAIYLIKKLRRRK